MVQGTASFVGKSLLVTALCRIFRRRGLKVAPFKAQNMSLNSCVTGDGLEVARAQAVQAEAAGAEICAEMNPILLKPEGESRSQVVVLGRPIGSLSAAEYDRRKPELKPVVAESLVRLRARHDLVVIEGAGSPAEINLHDRDIVNMHVARLAGAPVLLVGDIDRGGVFAAFVGTLALLPPEERALVRGLVVNKFRGDRGLLAPALPAVEGMTGVPVLGVVPFIPDLRLPDEDSLGLDARRAIRPAPGEVEVAVVRFPRISNFDDFAPLEAEPRASLRFVEGPQEVAGADLVVLPGSKSTAADLRWLEESGLARSIRERARRDEPVLGVCGGCQMLGRVIEDPEGVESQEKSVEGLGLLPLRTRFEREKVTARVRARALAPSFLTSGLGPGEEVEAYEIRMGRLEPEPAVAAPFEVVARNGTACRSPDGAVGRGGAVVGTLLHGLFENPGIRAGLLAWLRRRRGWEEEVYRGPAPDRDAAYDRLAAVVEASLDMEAVERLVAPAMKGGSVR